MKGPEKRLKKPGLAIDYGQIGARNAVHKCTEKANSMTVDSVIGCVSAQKLIAYECQKGLKSHWLIAKISTFCYNNELDCCNKWKAIECSENLIQ